MAKQDSIAAIFRFEKERKDYHETIALREKYIGFKYVFPKSADFISVNGSPQTLSGTDNSTWVVYFPKGDITWLFRSDHATVFGVTVPL